MKSITNTVPLEKLIDRLPDTYPLAEKELVQCVHRVGEEPLLKEKRISNEPSAGISFPGILGRSAAEIK